jgi:23S rRNA pseudouridine1911/1915/1917 synthase
MPRTSSSLLHIPVLYEDDDVLVINKPAGLVVHSDGRTKEPTVVDWILKKYPKIKDVGDLPFVNGKGLKMKDSERSLDRSGIVHRLDRETSGALLIAKNQTAFARLKKQFQRQEVHKTYHAFVYGSMKNDDGLIDRPIARSRNNPVLWSATRGRKGEDREAITEYRVLKRFTKSGEAFSFLELYPRTGRTHQLRVHLKAINYPIVSDKLYAPNHEPALGFERLALHSRAISFIQPATGKRMTVEAPYPADFQNAMTRMNVAG